MKAEDVRIGMKVRVVILRKHATTHKIEQLGNILTVKDIDPFGAPIVVATGDWKYWADEVEPVSETPKFNGGDRVRVISKNSNGYGQVGKEGIVVTGTEHFIPEGAFNTSIKYCDSKVDTTNPNWDNYSEDCLELVIPHHEELPQGHKTLIGIDWAGDKSETVTLSTYGKGCSHYELCNKENKKSKTYGPNKCDQCREAGRYLRIKEVNDMEEEKLNDVCKQLNIEIVGQDSGCYILKDGRIGTIQNRSVTITLTQAEKRSLISKLPSSISSRAFVVKDSELSFESYYFKDNRPPKEDVTEESTSE